MGEAACGRRGTFARSCFVAGGGGASFVHSREGEAEAGSKVAVRGPDGFGLVYLSLRAQREVTISCTPEAMLFHQTSTELRFLSGPDYVHSGFSRPMQDVMTVQQHKCTIAGCTVASGELNAQGSSASAAPLGDGFVVVELVGNRDEGGGLVARIGGLDDLGDAPVQWVLDSSERAILHFATSKWAISPSAAVAFVADEDRGLMALRFDADGTYSYMAP